MADDSPHVWTISDLRDVAGIARDLCIAHCTPGDERIGQAIEVEIAHRRAIGMSLAGAVVSVTADLEDRRWVP